MFTRPILNLKKKKRFLPFCLKTFILTGLCLIKPYWWQFIRNRLENFSMIVDLFNSIYIWLIWTEIISTKILIFLIYLQCFHLLKRHKIDKTSESSLNRTFKEKAQVLHGNLNKTITQSVKLKCSSLIKFGFVFIWGTSQREFLGKALIDSQAVSVISGFRVPHRKFPANLLGKFMMDG